MIFFSPYLFSLNLNFSAPASRLQYFCWPLDGARNQFTHCRPQSHKAVWALGRNLIGVLAQAVYQGRPKQASTPKWCLMRLSQKRIFHWQLTVSRCALCQHPVNMWNVDSNLWHYCLCIHACMQMSKNAQVITCVYTTGSCNLSVCGFRGDFVLGCVLLQELLQSCTMQSSMELTRGNS